MNEAKKAFSLTELLVVIGILGLLCAILLPVFFAVRQKAHQATCASNLKQLTLATLAYTQDYDASFPFLNAPGLAESNSRTEGCPFWEPPLQPYVTSVTDVKAHGVFACPSCQLPARLPQPARVAGYAMNLLIASGLTRHAADGDAFIDIASGDLSQPGRESEFVFPASTVLYAEVHFQVNGNAVLHQETTVVPDVAEPNQAGPEWTIVGKAGAVRHGGGSEYACADGHVKWQQPEQVAAVLEANDGVRLAFRP